MAKMNRQEIKNELLLFSASILVVAGVSLLPTDGDLNSLTKVAVGVGLVLVGVAVYIIRGYYKKKIEEQKYSNKKK